MIVYISVGLALGLIGLGLLAMIISGVQSTINGKQNFKRIGMMIVPFVVFFVSYAIAGTVVKAGIITMIFMLAAMALAILASGLRSSLT